MLRKAAVTNHEMVFTQDKLSIKDICDELKKFRLRLFGDRRFQEPEIRLSKFGLVKSPKDETLVSLREELIECKLRSAKARKSSKEIKKIIERNKRSYRRKFNSKPDVFHFSTPAPFSAQKFGTKNV